ncbi:prepilin peptidase [Dactylosporangium sp. NPDC051484]|uniref:prepilin peptidase n=1 Tax=Dactylosporangium sp. NPDC051484 TaxID=3154942 RepID=UPI00344EF0C4
MLLTQLALLLPVTLLLGLAVGSFLNVVIHRVPRGESLVTPPSRCPNCGNGVRHRHNIPVLGWLVLRGRCADCGVRIGVRYPLVELTTALLFVAVALRMHQLHLLSALPAYLYVAAAGIALAVIDLDWRRLPNVIVLPSYPVVAILLTLSAAWEDDWWALARSAIGAAALLAFFFTLAFAYPAGMGFGDVKLAGILGGVLGYLSWSALAIGAFAGFLLGAVVGVGIIVARKGDRKTAIPFGPFMIAGFLVALFAAAPIAQFYVDVMMF